ncbi:MAG: hypothetical protein H6584_06270 [Flavobacteriales bacterium]|nr:hypothetical protein [Flavobacteriales bacterium]
MSRFNKNKPLRYFVGLGVVIVLLEVLLNLFPIVFSNLTERVRIKSAMFQNRNSTQILFLGSSRFNDAIAPKKIVQFLENNNDIKLRAFNGAFAWNNIQNLDFFFNKAIGKPGLDVVVIEVSPFHLFFENKEELEQEGIDAVEYKLQNYLAEHLKLARWRRSFRVENLIKTPFIVFSDYLDGTEIYRTNLIQDVLDNKGYQFTDSIRKLWQPGLIVPNQPMSGYGEDSVMHILQNIVKLSEKHNVDLLFVIPPTVNERNEKENSKETLDFYQNVANNTGHTILNYGTLNISENLFSDKDSHLNKEGRSYFSSSLAEVIAKYYPNP